MIATQNPVELEGTYPLPEAQLDRFRLRVQVGYPDDADERDLVTRRLDRGHDEIEVPTVTDPAGLLALRATVEQVHVDPSVTDYAVRLARATREDRSTEVGASPRGSLGLVLVARARALLRGRGYVVPDDVADIAVPVLAHRLLLRPDQWVRGVRPEEVVRAVVERTDAPPPVPPDAP
jgi:MoxR-like ATPase